MKNKKYWIFGITLLIFILTNPSLKAFKDFLGTNSNGNIKRTANFFVFSKYKYINGSEGYYIGVLGNFFYVKPPKVNSQKVIFEDSAKVADSIKMLDSFKTH